MSDLEVRHWNPAHDETEWIVIGKDKPTDGYPAYIARLPYAYYDLALVFAAAPEMLAASEAALTRITDDHGCLDCGLEGDGSHVRDCIALTLEAAIAKAKLL